MIRNVYLQKLIGILAVGIVFCESLADVRAHYSLLATLLVVVAGGERGLAEACDGEILFFRVRDERLRDALTELSEAGEG